MLLHTCLLYIIKSSFGSPSDRDYSSDIAGLEGWKISF